MPKEFDPAEVERQEFAPGWEKEHGADYADYLDSLHDPADPSHEVAVAAGGVEPVAKELDQIWIVTLGESDEEIQDGDAGFATTPVGSVEAACEALAEDEMDLVLVMDRVGEPSAVEVVAAIRQCDHSIPVFVVSEKISASLLRSAIHVGATDVFEGSSLADTAREAVAQARAVQEHQQWRRPNQVEGGATVVAVMSAIAGSGKTVTATNLALALNRGHGSRVVIFDMDGEGVDVCTSLGIQPRSPISLSGQRHQMSEAAVEAGLAVHPSGIQVLAARAEPGTDTEEAPKAISHLLSVLGGMCDFVIVDASSHFDESLLSILKRSDQVLFVADRRRQSVQLSKLILGTLRMLEFPLERLHLVLVDKTNDED